MSVRGCIYRVYYTPTRNDKPTDKDIKKWSTYTMTPLSNGAGVCLCKECIHPPFAIKGHRFLPTEKKSKLMFEHIIKMFLYCPEVYNIQQVTMATKFTASPDLDVLKEEKDGKVREVGNQAVWSLSSCKPAFGVDQLRDGSYDTYWQSDGPQPHLVNIQFRKKTTVQDVCVYTDYKADESYTPNRISVRAGSQFHDLVELEQVELNEPVGWVCIPLKDTNDKPIRTFMIQIAILSNHQNGRDTHVRRIKIRSPVQNNSLLTLPKFTSPEFNMKAHIR